MGCQTHKTVVEFARQLKERDVKVWLDDDNIRGYIAKDIVQGLQASKKIIVFLTRRCLHRVDNPDTNALKEFASAMWRGVKNVIVVVLDKRVLTPKTWVGTVVEYHLGRPKLFDFSTPEAVEANKKECIQM